MTNPTPPNFESEVENAVDELCDVYYKNAKLTSLADTYFIAQLETKQAILAAHQDAVERAVKEALRESYHERALLVAAFSRLYPSHTCVDDNEPDWMVVCIHTPNGQAGWHISTRDKKLFNHLEPAPNHYDGHTTGEKYRRLGAINSELQDGSGENG